MRLYDISVPISAGLPVWPGDPPVRVEPIMRVEAGDPASVSRLELGTHTGTHVDPPAHFVAGGQSVDALPLERLIGPAWLADCRGAERITSALLDAAAIPPGTTRLLLRTDNSALWEDPHHPFVPAFVHLAPDAAHWIVARGIELVGLDYMSVDGAADEASPAHQTLLPAGVILVENLDLRHVPPDRPYELLCLPLRIAGGDGAPARVVLRGP